MSLSEAERTLDAVLNGGRVRRKTNTTKDLRAKVNRVARGSPEVMVKITGFGKGAQHIQAHLRYITRNAKLELETERQEVLRDKEAIKHLFGQWTDEIAHTRRRKNQRDTMHMVLSMPAGTPETAVASAVRAYAKRIFGANHEYVFALHTDEPHPHVHLTVKMLGFDGKRLNPRKADLQTWREAFAREMRDQGIDAEATPRSARGVIRKPEQSIVRHIEHGHGRPPRTPQVKAAGLKQVAAELIAEAKNGVTVEKPWEVAIKHRQQYVRSAWLMAATALEKNASRFKEACNARPDYDRLDTRRVQAGQRAAAVYQSNLERPGFRAPAIAIARMRDLSRLDVVQHQRPAQVLLHPHAPDRMGRYGSTDHDLRRPRARALTFATRAKGDGEGDVHVNRDGPRDKSLATAIRAFVESMPPIDTARHALKRRLISQFTRSQDSAQSRAPQSTIPNSPDNDTKTLER